MNYQVNPIVSPTAFIQFTTNIITSSWLSISLLLIPARILILDYYYSKLYSLTKFHKM